MRERACGLVLFSLLAAVAFGYISGAEAIMNHEQSAIVRKLAPISEYEDLKPQGKAGPLRQVKRSPLPSAREIDAAIERKYGAPPYREMALSV